MKLSKLRLAVVALIITNLIWGASPPIFKWSLSTMPPFTFIFIRFLLASLLLLPFVGHNLLIRPKDIFKISMLAYIGFTLHISSVFLGLTLAPSINAPIIASAAPIFLMIAGCTVLREKLKRKVLIGTLCSLIGVVLIVLMPLLKAGVTGELLGNLLFLVGTASFVLYTILYKQFHLPYPSSVITFWTFAIATITFFPFFLWETQTQQIVFSSQSLFGILFGAVFTSSVAYLLFNFAVHYIHANEVGIFLYMDPVITIFIAIPLLGETITPLFICGAFLVFAGIFIAEGRVHYHPLQKVFRS